MHIAVDVDYRGDDSAVAAGAVFADWTSGRVERMVVKRLAGVRPYVPGRFFERELPCILAVVGDLAEPPETVLIDGYVVLGGERRDGLGAHLHRALGGGVPVVGIAKNRFRDTPADAEVLRGGSARPLYVTSIGMDEETARRLVRAMHGRFRLPTLLAAADRACRAG